MPNKFCIQLGTNLVISIQLLYTDKKGFLLVNRQNSTKHSLYSYEIIGKGLLQSPEGQ